MPIKVTFDTNTFDKVSRPAVYPGDPRYAEMVAVHEALKRGDVQGFICETAITLEGIGVDHRAAVFCGTIARSSIAQVSEDTFSITITPEQPERRPVHPKQVERFIEAFRLGIRLLGAPRGGLPRAEEQFYATEEPPGLEDRLSRFGELERKIEERGIGCARARALAAELAGNTPPQGPWFASFAKAKDTQTREVARAIAEWADGDSVAAHYGYGNDFFCTLDEGKGEKKRGNSSVFDEENRKWLTDFYGIRFLTIRELAEKFRK